MLPRSVLPVPVGHQSLPVPSAVLRCCGLALAAWSVSVQPLAAQAPGTERRPEPRADTIRTRRDSTPPVLARVVVTGTVTPTRQRELPTPVTVITAAEIAARGVTNVEELFRGYVPGVVSFEQGERSAFNTSSISVRGASSLTSGNTVKTYVDGIELANPSYLRNIDPATIERIEVVRGPQASTLYGSQAIAGVVQVFTKKGRIGDDRTRLSASADGGAIRASDTTRYGAVANGYVSLEGGSNNMSYAATLTGRSTGAWGGAGSYERFVGGSIGLRRVDGPFVVEGTYRLGTRAYGFPLPRYTVARVAAGQFGYAAGSLVPWGLRYTQPVQSAGLTVQYAARPFWTHALTLGLDDNDVRLVQSDARYTSPADSTHFLQVTDARRTSVLYTTTLDGRVGERLALNLVGGINYWQFDRTLSQVVNSAVTVGPLTGTPSLQRSDEHDVGYFVQGRAGVADRVFATAGLRATRNSNFGDPHQYDWSPRFGVSVVQDVGAVTAKLRAEYGRAIRPPTYANKVGSASPTTVVQPNLDLGPERQAGTDVGLDVFVGDRGSLQATYFSQLASGLIQQLTLSAPFAPVFVSRFENIGRVKNSGVELEGQVQVTPALAARGTFTAVRSTVVTLDPRYAGTYRVGDPVNGVPSRSALGAVTYSARRAAVTAEVTLVAGVRDFDSATQTDLLLDRVAPTPNTAVVVRYPQVVRYNARAVVPVARRLDALVYVDNLANDTRSMSATVLNNTAPGRMVRLGVRLRSE